MNSACFFTDPSDTVMSWQCDYVIVHYPDGAEVHGVFDDVMVVVQLQSLGVDWLVEGPGVGSVFLREHLLQDGVTVLHLLTQLTTLPSPGPASTSSQLAHSYLLACLPAGLGRAGGCLAAGRAQFGWFGVLSGRRVCATSRDGRRGWSGGVGFPLHTFLLLETDRCEDRQVETKTGKKIQIERDMQTQKSRKTRAEGDRWRRAGGQRAERQVQRQTGISCSMRVM